MSPQCVAPMLQLQAKSVNTNHDSLLATLSVTWAGEKEAAYGTVMRVDRKEESQRAKFYGSGQ